MKILIDNGHGKETKGKCSPDGKLKEYEYCRRIARTVVESLKSRGFDASLLTPEEEDVSLKERCERANAICRKFGSKNVILISIHLNAAGNGKEWMKATGWEAWTSKGQTRADSLADALYESAKRVLLPLFPEENPLRFIRTDFSDGDADKESDFYILRHTNCAAVLTENLFQDNLRDAEWLQSAEGLDAIARLHTEGIQYFISAAPNALGR